MSQLGDVLELLHGSGSSWATIRLEGREWHHQGRNRAAFDRFRKSRGHPPSVLPGPQTESEDPWEYGEIAGQRRYARFGSRDHIAYVVFDGSTWWSWTDHPGRPGITNEGSDRDFTHGIGPGEVVLTGATVIPWLDMTVGEAVNVAGRKAITVYATPRSGEDQDGGWTLYRLGTGADHYVLAVDCERGVILRSEAQLHEEPYRIVEVTSAAFDQPIGQAQFEVPSDIKFRTRPEPKPPLT